ncbi:MAG: hypothetical protein QW404_03670 [Candidatus Nanoarchaeia archaeon]
MNPRGWRKEHMHRKKRNLSEMKGGDCRHQRKEVEKENAKLEAVCLARMICPNSKERR